LTLTVRLHITLYYVMLCYAVFLLCCAMIYITLYDATSHYDLTMYNYIIFQTQDNHRLYVAIVYRLFNPMFLGQ